MSPAKEKELAAAVTNAVHEEFQKVLESGWKIDPTKFMHNLVMRIMEVITKICD